MDVARQDGRWHRPVDGHYLWVVVSGCCCCCCCFVGIVDGGLFWSEMDRSTLAGLQGGGLRQRFDFEE